MAKYEVLLICGSGASSGFMVTNIRKAVEKNNIDMNVNARSESELQYYVDDINCLMIGPHLASYADSIMEEIKGYDIKSAVIDAKAYGKLDGEAVLSQVLSLFND